MNNLIIKKQEAVNNKFDVREVYLIDVEGFKQLRFLNEITAEIFLSKLEGLRLKQT